MEQRTYQITDPVAVSKGNKKIGFDTPNVSLPPIIACQKGVPCASQGCYAVGVWNQYPNVRRAWMHNLGVLNHNFDKYFSDIRGYLLHKDPPYFRWHVGGDIPSQRYLDAMVVVADAFPKTQMLAFTKNYTLDLSKCPTNLAVIPSMWPQYGPNDIDRPKAWLWDPKNEDHRVMSNYYECNTKCTDCYACWHIGEIGKDVVFHKHR
jgi:hypothetical protein